MEKRKIHVLEQPEEMERVHIAHRDAKTSMRLISLRVSIVIVLLAVGIAFDIGMPRQQAYAKSACGILFSCPTPTPMPTATPPPAPTPTPISAPNPTPTTPPLQATPTAASGPVLAPSATANAAPTPIGTAAAKPTATPTRKVQKTPVSTATPVPATHDQQADSHPTSQSEGNGFSHMLMIIGLIFCVLLSILGIGLLIFRRMLLPPIKMKLPSSGVTSWTRTLTFDSFSGLERASDIQDAPFVESFPPTFAPVDHEAGTLVNSLVSSPPILPPDTASVVAANDETSADLSTHNATTSWYDVSDEPFTT